MKMLLKMEAVAIVIGTIIGAGVLGIPYVFAQSNFFTATLTLFVVGLAMLMLLLFLGEVALRTKSKHQLTGFAEIYLGKAAKHFLGLIVILSIYGSLLAYIIAEGQVISAILGGSSDFWSFVFFGVFASLVIMGLKTVKVWELFLTLGIFSIVAVIGWISVPEIHTPHLNGFSLNNIFTVYGVVLFACSGIAAVGEVRDLLFGHKKERLMKQAIIWGTLLPLIVYFVFSVLVVGVTGPATTEVATIGLGNALGEKMIILGNLFAFITMGGSFLALGIALREIFNFDYGVPDKFAPYLVVIPPVLIFIAGVRGFIEVISLVGAVGTGLAGIISVFIFWSARSRGNRKPEYKIPSLWAFLCSLILIAIFAAGIVYVFV